MEISDSNELGTFPFDTGFFEGSFIIFPFLPEVVELLKEIVLDSNRSFSDKLSVVFDPMPIISIMFRIGLFRLICSAFFDDFI